MNSRRCISTPSPQSTTYRSRVAWGNELKTGPRRPVVAARVRLLLCNTTGKLDPTAGLQTQIFGLTAIAIQHRQTLVFGGLIGLIQVVALGEMLRAYA